MWHVAGVAPIELLIRYRVGVRIMGRAKPIMPCDLVNSEAGLVLDYWVLGVHTLASHV